MLIFSSSFGANWNIPQTFTVTGVQDADAADENTDITHSASGADYDGVTVDDVAVTITDDETVSVAVSNSAVTVMEGGAGAYTVTLTSEPVNGDVTVTPSIPTGTDLTLSPATGGLTFNAGNWNVAQMVALATAEDDDAVDDAIVITHAATGADYDAAPAVTVAVTITDDETISVAVSDSAVTVMEGGAGAYTVTLTSAPVNGDVTVTPSIPSGTDLTLSPATGGLTFNAGNWNVAQMVALSAAEDDDAVDDAIVITHTATGADYDAAPAVTVAVTIDDNDNVGVTVTPDTLALNENEFATYTVELTSAPSVGEVTVTPSSADTGAVSVTAALVFDAANWDTPQVVSVGGVADDDATNESVEITNTVTVSDGSSEYATATADEVTVTVTDTSIPAVTIAPTDLTVAEGGNRAYTVQLATEPAAGAQVMITPSVGGDVADHGVTIAPSAALLFDAATWNTAQSVVVAAAEDNLDFADATATISHAVAGYTGVTNAADVVVTVDDDDDDTAPAFASGASVPAQSYTENAQIPNLTLPEVATATPGNGDITYMLTPIPSGLNFDATNRVLSGTPDTVTTTAITLTYTAADEDGNTAASDTASLLFTVTVEAAPVLVGALVFDIDPLALSVAEGGSGGYTIALSVAPSGDVTVTPSVLGAAADHGVTLTSAAELVFDGSNWDTPQGVSVAAAADAVEDFTDELASIRHAVTGGGLYASVADTFVTVTVDDDDTDTAPRFGTSRFDQIRDFTGVVGVSTTFPLQLTFALAGTGNGALTYTLTPDLATAAPGLTIIPPATPGGPPRIAGTPLLAVDVVMTYTVHDADSNRDASDSDSQTFRIRTTYATPPAITAAPANLRVGEGFSAVYTLSLNNPVPDDVVITPSAPAGSNLAASAVTFTRADWNTARTVTVTAAVDNNAINDTVTVTHTVTGVPYDTVSAPQVVVTITDAQLLGDAPTFGGASVAAQTYDRGFALVPPVTLPEATGGFGALSYALTPSGDIPNGLNFDTITRVLSGTPDTLAAAVTLTLTVTDQDADTSPADSDSLRFAVAVAETTASACLRTPQVRDAILAAAQTANPSVTLADCRFVTATHLAGITRLDVAGVGSLQSGDFAGLSGMTTLSVIDSSLTSLPAGLLDGLSALTTFILARTNVAVLPSGLFSDTPNLTDLRLSQNRLAALPAGLFEGLDFSRSGSQVRLNLNPGSAFTLGLRVERQTSGLFRVRVVEGAPGPVTVTWTQGSNTGSVTILGGGVLSDEFGAVGALPVLSNPAYASGTVSVNYIGIVPGILPPLVPAALVFDSTALSVDEGNTVAYTIELSVAPDSGNVVVTPSAATGLTLAPATLTFTATSWNTAQSVVITAARDADTDNETVTVSHAVAGAGNYAALTAGGDVTVTVTDTTIPAVTISTATLSVNEGESDAYTVVLATSPTDNVVITPTSTATATVSGPLTFTAGNWNVAQSVIVTGVADADAAANADAVISHAAVSADTDYDGITGITDVTVTITEAQTRGVTVAPSTLSGDEGAEIGAYTVVLTSAPAGGDVTVTPSGFAATDVTLSPSGALTFAAGNWNAEQTITVTAGDDVDFANDTVTLTHAVTGADYAGTNAGNVVVTVNDTTVADTAPAFASGASVPAQSYTENAQITALTLPEVDAAMPGNGAPRYTLTPDIATAIPGLTFDDSTRVVSGTPDAATAAAVTLTYTVADSDGNNAATDTASLTFTVTVNPAAPVTPAALVFDSTALSVDEGGTATYGIELSVEPDGGNVVVTPTATTGLTLEPATLTFTDATWNTAQSVTITVARDDDTANETLTVSHTVVGAGNYTALSTAGGGDVTVTVTDTSIPAVTISDDTLSVNEGGSDTYTVRLATIPTANVVITPTATSTATVSGPLTFTAGNWNDAQTVTVTGVADDDAVANTDAVISHAATGAAEYVAVSAIDDVTVTVTETDSVGFTVTPQTLSLNEGFSDSYTVVLTSAPSVGEVTVTPSSPDSAAVSVFSGTAELTFTSANWNVAQVVSVIAEPDDDANDEMVVIGNTVTVSDSSSDYNNETAAGVTVSVTDPTAPDTAPSFGAATVDDETYTAGVAIPDLILPLATPGNGATTYTLTPDIDTAIDGLNFDDTMRVVSGTPSAATAAVTLTYTAADSDGNNAATDTASLTFAITVVPAPTLVFAQTALSVDEGGTGTYGIELSVAPTTGNVVVTPSATGLTLAPATLTFTATSWDTAQSVVITAARDDDTANETIAVSHAVAGTGNYTGLATAGGGDFTVTVTDTSIPAVTIAPLDLTVDEGDDGAYTVQLATEPAAGAQVMVTPTVEGTGHGVTIAPNTVLVFDSTDWNTAQSVVVSAADDDLDFADSTATISHAVAGYTGVTGAADVVVTVDDDDDDTAPAFAIGASVPAQSYTENAQITALTLPEVATATPGNGDITYALTPIPSGLNFDATTRILSGTPNAVATTTTLTYTAADEDGNTAATDTASLRFTVTVDPAAPAVVAAVTIAPPTLTIAEGAMDTYTVTLTTDPGGAVTVTPTSDNIADVPTPAALTFATGAWNTPQTVTVNANADVLEDFADESAEITHVVTGYSGVATAPAVAVTVTDSDTNTVPSFAATQADQAYTVGETVDLTLPEASGGNGAPRYTLTPDIATAITGLTFDDNTRIVSGTPNAVTTAAVTLTYTAADSDAVTAGDTVSLTFTVTVDPAPVVIPAGVTISTPTLTVNEGGDGTYTVVLDTQPSADVTITPTIPLNTDLTGNPSALTFTAMNWNAVQTVTLTAAEDDDAVDDAPVVITHTVEGADYGSNNITAANVTATITENDDVGITVAPTDLNIDEGGASGTYTVVLTSAPSVGNVTVMRDNGDPAAKLGFGSSPTSLLFTAANWNMPQTVSVGGATDGDDTDDVATITHMVTVSDVMSDYNGATAAPVTVNVNDTGRDELRINPTTLTINEDGSGIYTIRLSSNTTGGAVAVVTLVSADTAIATVFPTTPITFASGTWATERTITVRGVADADFDNETVTITHTVTGYNAPPAVVTVTVLDTTPADTAPAFVSGVPVPDQTYTAGTQIATLTLPEVDSNNPGNGAPVYTLTPTTDIPGGLNFDDTARTLSGTPNAVVAATTVTLTYTVADSDGVSGAADEDSLTFAVTVNPAAPVTPAGVTISTPTLTVTEGGDGNYTVRLDTQPSADVMITPSVTPATATVSPTGALTFTDMNWNVEQTVTVTGVADADATANDDATVSHAATSTDSDYVIANTGIDTVTVTITEAQTRGVTIAPTALPVDEGDNNFYTVALTSEPVGTVVVTPDASAGAFSGITITPTTALMFDSGNWNTAQTVSVFAGEDNGNFDDETLTISHAVSGYGSVTSAAHVVVTVDDNDAAPVTAAVTIDLLTLTIVEGAMDTYIVTLTTDPSGEVVVTPTSDNLADVPSPDALTFAAGAWNTPQTVTVTTNADVLEDFADESAQITHTVSGYTGVTTAPAVAVTVTDNDTNSAPAFVSGVSVPDQSYTGGTPITALVLPEVDPNADGNGDITYTLTPIPAGLVFTDTTRTLSGTPNAVSTATTTTLTYTAADSDTETGAADEASQTFTVTVNPAAPVVAVTLRLEPDALTIDEGADAATAGAGSIYTVRLSSQPASDVTVTPSIAATDHDLTLTYDGAALLGAALTFVAAEWNDAQTVTVTAAADPDTSDDTVTITHAATGTSASIAADEVVVTVTDTSTPGIALSPATLNVDEGATAIYGDFLGEHLEHGAVGNRHRHG